MMKSFNALRVHNTNGVYSVIEEVLLSELPPGEILIHSHYSSVNYKDALAATGQGKILKSFPMIAGIDVAGVVVESQDQRFKRGDEVLVTGYGLGQEQDGGYSEYVRVPADWVVSLVQGLSMRDAMILGTAGFTAALAIQRMIDNGQTPEQGAILVTGASGGVGSFAINCLSQLGYKVVALTGKIQAQQYLRDLGASTVLNRYEVELGHKPLEKSQWAGAIDTLGGEMLSWITRSVGQHGNIASCGLAAGIQMNTTVMPFLLRGINLLGIDSANWPMSYRQQLWRRLATDLKPDKLEQILTATVQLQDLDKVFTEMIAGHTQGRYLVQLI